MDASKSKTAQIISWTAYPTVVVSGLILNGFLLDLDYPLQVSTYIPIVLGIVIITFFEHKFPYRKEWLPNTSDVRDDATFMVAVQVILPRLLSFPNG